jgi:hypothetical protein
MENNYGTGLYQDGVFYFTNPGIYKNPKGEKTKEEDTTMDWSVLWNNKEYTFKGQTTVPLVIPGEPPENIQAIRKKFAKKYAQACFHQSKKYQDLVKKGGYIPATYDEDTEFVDMIQACLTPLAKSSVAVKELPRDAEKNYSSKAMKTGEDLNKAFAEYEVPTLGQM